MTPDWLTINISGVNGDAKEPTVTMFLFRPVDDDGWDQQDGLVWSCPDSRGLFEFLQLEKHRPACFEVETDPS